MPLFHNIEWSDRNLILWWESKSIFNFFLIHEYNLFGSTNRKNIHLQLSKYIKSLAMRYIFSFLGPLCRVFCWLFSQYCLHINWFTLEFSPATLTISSRIEYLIDVLGFGVFPWCVFFSSKFISIFHSIYFLWLLLLVRLHCYWKICKSNGKHQNAVRTFVAFHPLATIKMKYQKCIGWKSICCDSIQQMKTLWIYSIDIQQIEQLK